MIINKFKLYFLPVIILIFTLSISIVSCSDKDVSSLKEDVNAEKLSLDKNFIKISEETKNYSGYIINVTKNQKLPTSELILKISSIVNSQLLSEDQFLHLNKLLRTNITERVVSNAEIISSNLDALNSKYNNIDDKILKETFNYQFKNDNRNLYAKSNSCGWRHYACLSAAYTAAVLCHAGCDTTALATTAGLGIPACVALCGTLQVFVSVQCYDSYCSNNEEETEDELDS